MIMELIIWTLAAVFFFHVGYKQKQLSTACNEKSITILNQKKIIGYRDHQIMTYRHREKVLFAYIIDNPKIHPAIKRAYKRRWSG